MPVTTPVDETPATAGTVDAHDTIFVKSTVDWSDRMPVALSCVEAPIARVELEEVTLMETRAAVDAETVVVLVVVLVPVLVVVLVPVLVVVLVLVVVVVLGVTTKEAVERMLPG
jgi:hypothetical protein